MVGMEVRQEHAVYVLPPRFDLGEALKGASSCVE
jgi:hypothetical protein